MGASWLWHIPCMLLLFGTNINPSTKVAAAVNTYCLGIRLHGTKDYLDLILVLAKYPRLKQTINLVPSLLLQIQDYVNGTALDPYLTATLTPVEQLTDQQRWFIIEHFFDAHHRTMIDPHPRYRELYEQRQTKGKTWCWQHWQPQDYGDLLAWHNLAWIDPLYWKEPEIAQWLSQGHNFSLSDRQRIIAKQREILSQIIPQAPRSAGGRPN